MGIITRAYRIKEQLGADLIVQLPNGGEIYQGPFPEMGERVHQSGIQLLVLAAEELQAPPALFPEVSIVYAPLDDHDRALSRSDRQISTGAAAHVVRAAQRGQRCLITCQAGRNRSGLITALVLVKLLGVSPAQAVKHIQRSRANALTNQSFVRQLPALAREM